MAERDLYDQQLSREEKSHQIGIERFQKAIKEAEEKMYSSHHLGGRMCITQQIDSLIKFIQPQFFKASPRRKKDGERNTPPVAAHAAAMFTCCVDLPAPQAVYIALMTMMDAAGMSKRIALDPKEHVQMEWSAVERLVGERLEKEAMLIHLKKNFPFAYKQIKEEAFLKNSGTTQKIYRVQRHFQQKADRIESMVEKGESFLNPHTGEVKELTPELIAQKTEIIATMRSLKWSASQRQQVGAWFVQKIVAADSPCAGWFTPVARWDGKKKRQYMQYSPDLRKIISDYHQSALSKAFLLLPMLVPPKDWAPPTSEEPKGTIGGFMFDAAVIARHFIRGHSRKSEISQMTYDFINTQQAKPFKINSFVVDVQRQMERKSWRIDDDAFVPWRMPDESDRPRLPDEYQNLPKVDEVAESEKEALIAKRKKRKSINEVIRQWHDRQAELREISRPTYRYFEIVAQVEHDAQFFFPWSIDNRTRCYPLVDGFNPQGPQYQKAALRWAEPVVIDKRTQYWLSIQLATTFGLSKESFDVRKAWIDDPKHHKMVCAVATDPLGAGYKVWTEADEPWNFLAIAREYWEIYIDQSKTFIDVFPTGVDATCSALQLLGGMTLDEKTCELVNCTPSPKPQDAYMAVLNRTVELIEADQKELEDKTGRFPVDEIRGVRALTKTPVMTLCYSAGHETRITQVTNALKEKKIKLAADDKKQTELIEYLVVKIEKAMDEVIPGAKEILGWFQKVARYLYEEEKADQILIPTASGNLLCHHYVSETSKQIRTEGYGDAQRMPRIIEVDDDGIPIGDPDIDGGVRALGANLTHGAGDAALIQLALHKDSDLLWATTHDCVYAPCGETIDIIVSQLKLAYIKLCKHQTLQKFCEVNGIDDLPPPMQNTYNPLSVMGSDYFFC